VKPKILVVDDERVIADTLVIILNRNGFEATAAYSGETAVELAESIQPEMVISDVIMNDMNGIDAAIHIRRILEKARSHGHEFEILAKPVHPQDLLMRLRS
jgi:DNA-binding response OmpR family regulator